MLQPLLRSIFSVLSSPRLSQDVCAGEPALSTARCRGVLTLLVGALGLLPLASSAQTISGLVYEDAWYGGGAGRAWPGAAGSGFTARDGARVELYNFTTNAGGAFVAAVNTAGGGLYSFSGANVVNGNQYRVRVVNGSVQSARTGWVNTLTPVSTYAGNDADAINRVGGPTPELTDPGNNAASTLATIVGEAALSNQFTATAGTVGNVNFGFNFDVVVSVRPNGLGSLRQFVTNANALSNIAPATIAQVGQTAGQEVSIFMIPDGLAHPGLLAAPAGPVSALTGGLATITITNSAADALPIIIADNTVIDGTTQTANIGNTNTGTLGLAGTAVGTGPDGVAATGDELTLSGVAAPEVEIVGYGGNSGAGNSPSAIRVNAAGVRVRGLGIRFFNTAAVTSLAAANCAGMVVEDNLFGVPTSLVVPTNNTRLGQGVALLGIVAGGGTGPIIRRNLIAGTRFEAVVINGSDQNNVISGALVENNEIRLAGSGNNTTPNPTGAAIFGTGQFGALTVQRNLIGVANTTGDYNGIGVTYTSVNAGGGSVNANNFLNNTLTATAGNGVLVAGGAAESANKFGTIGRNVITGGDFDGVRMTATGAIYVITRNSISGNAGLGIDLVGTAGVDLNDNGDGDGGPNGLLNFPVIEYATVVGTNLQIGGWARNNSIIELFRNAAPDGSGFGEGLTYLTSVTESISDLDGTVSSYGPAAVNGVAQGQDNTTRFRFVVPLPAGLAAGDFLSATATLPGANSTSEFGGRIQVASILQGTVFEDVNYGGGVGRTYAVANTSATASGFAAGVIRRQNAIVERYTSGGVLIDTARTNANGIYTFRTVAGGITYTLRVVNSSVTSARAGYVSTLLPVQTYNGTTDRVGGEAPQLVDAPANNPAAPVTLASLTTGTATPQSLANVTATAAISGVDFGFNFDLIVSTRDAGQGSLRQFITNANALGNEALLAQSGSTRSALNGATQALVAQREASIFMIPNGTAQNGLRVGLVNQLDANGVAVITAASVLPTITGPSTSLDGRTQSFNLNNPNNAALAVATTAGTGATAVTALNGLEVQLVGNGALAVGLDATSAATAFRLAGFAVYGFGVNAAGTDADVRSAAATTLITQNAIGTSAVTFADPGAGRSLGAHVLLTAGTGAQITQNLIGYGNGAGIRTLPSGVTITGNRVVSNGIYAALNQDGLDVQGSGATITGNLLTDNGAAGLELGSSPGAATVSNNTITGSGRFGTRSAGIRVGGTLSIISLNIVSGSYGAGVLVIATATQNRLSQNHIFNNGTVTGLPATPATGQLGIDLLSAADNQQTGTAPFITVNDAADADGGGNGLANFPILSTVAVTGSTLTVTGFARPNTVVEFFIASPSASGFGEGTEYLVTRTENTVDDTDAGTGTYGPAIINGLSQGTDNTNRFTFSLPFATLTVAQQNAIMLNGLAATGTLSNATSEFSGNAVFLRIEGTVFEDINYGGGAGRDFATANTSATASGFASGVVGRPNARVELYDNTGTLVQATTTDAAGVYRLTGVTPATNHTVRVVNNTVLSARPGATAGLSPVQTFIVRNGTADANRVGGEAPERIDAPASGAAPTTLIELVGLNPSGGDNTAFVDLVAIGGAPSAILNPSFETPSQGGGFSYNTAGASWTFVGQSGLAANGSAFGPPAPPGGSQVAFVQGTGVASQTISLPPGTYTLTLQAAQRACCSATNNQRIEVRVNGVAVGSIQPIVGSGYQLLTSSAFTIGAAPAVTLASLNTATTIAQSQAPVAVGSSNVLGVDFGYSFDVVCNTTNGDQGSLRQFLVNANTLGNANLAQAGQTAGRETTIFMIPSGTAVAGLRAGLVNQLTGAVGDSRAIIQLPISGVALPLTDAGTTIDGITQTNNVGNTNTGTLGSTEFVGADALAVVPANQTEVEIVGNTGVGAVLSLTGANGTVRNVAVRGGNQSIQLTGAATGYLIENNLIGTSAIAYQWENDATVSGNFGIGITGTAVGTIQNNLVGFTGNSGIDIDNGLATVAVTTIQGNQFNQNGYTSAGGDGISLGDSGGSGPMLIQGNLFTRSNSSAVQFEIQQTSISQVLNNTMVSCGKGGAGAALSSLEGSAICYLQRNGARRGTQADVISKNVIVDTQASAIVVGYGQSNVTISQNSIFNSGTIAIDLVFNPNAYVGGPGSGAVEYGSGDGVSLNEGTIGTPPTALPNRGTDYSVLASLDILSGNMIIEGFSRPGATIELFVPALDPTRFGEGRTFLYARVEGSVDDTNGGTGAYGPGAVNTLLQGSDAAANRFTFTVPFSTLPASVQAAILTNGLTSTATINGNTSEFSGDVTLRANVYATITPAATPVAGGTTGQFDVVFGNFGPSSATGITAVVQLPTGLGAGVVATNGGVYNNSTGVVTYTGLTQLLSGQTLTSAITYPQPLTQGAVTGTASISTVTNENGQFSDNVRTATIVTAQSFDLTTTLNGPATAVPGALVTYGVITRNLGPTSAANVVQTVQLPTGLADVFVTNGGTYNSGTGVVTFPAIPGLASGQRRNNAISFLAPAATFNLTADVTPLTGDVNTANNTTAVPLTTTVSGVAGPPANVFVEVTNNAPTAGVAPGAPVTFNVTQGNYGPQTATNVVTRLALQPGLTGVVVSGFGLYSSTTGLVTWPLVASQLTSATPLTYTATFNAPASGLLTGTASVTTTAADPVPANNVATTEVTINNPNITDVRITLDGPARGIAGQLATYTVVTTNAGFSDAADVRPTVALPTGLSGVVVSGGGTYSALTGIVTFPVTASLAPGNALVNSITLTTPLNDATTFPLAASVFTSSTELVPANNVARVATLLQAYADVEVLLTGPPTSTVGSQITYVVTTRNNGPAVSNGHTLTVQLPSSLAGVTVVGGGSYNSMSGLVTFTAVANQLPTANGSLVRTITFTAPDRSFVTPTASLTITGSDDPITTNNLAVFTTAIATPTVLRADVGTTVTASVPTQTAGLPITFTVNTTNAGPNPATSPVQQLALRPGLTGVVVGGGGTYDTNTGIVTWNPATIASGSFTTNTVTVNAPGSGPLLATAIASAAETDLNVPNNRATASVTITPAADVVVNVNGRSVTEPGAVVTYSVTTLNSGASPATGVITTVQLPTGLTGMLITGGGTYNSLTGLVTFPTLGVQPVGSAGVVTNTITFNAPLTNYSANGLVTTTSTDPVPGNNTDVQLTSTSVNRKPIAFDVVNTLQAPRGETSTDDLLISPLLGTDPDGSVVSFTVRSLPAPTQGVLTLGGTPVTVSQVLTLAQGSLLEFEPAAGFAGNAFFTYSATDNLGAVGNTAIYTIPVGRDNASLYTNSPVLGGMTPYVVNSPIATVFDANGGEYATGPVVSDNGTRSVFLAPLSAPLPAGTALDAVTGRLFVSNPLLLVAGTYTVTITTIDEFAGETTQPVTFTIGNNPLPVELRTFTARASGLDGVLAWTTASEKNNAYFAVERSRDGGRTFAEIGRRTGAGTTPVPQEYALTDSGVGRTAGTVYYRLRQVDTDGKFSFSDVRAIAFTGGVVGGPLTAYPNPVAGGADATLTVAFDGQVAGSYALTLYDAAGRAVLTAAHAVGAGAEAAQLAVGTLPAGTYTLRVTSAEGYNSTLRVVRQ